ncbi:MAG: hypothetical protein BWY75_02217 [bacterium ADurb.Bin425]|nr:MAG: hypothetical protein BWY75_02217 [bacterium ADurb.Bin425]
MNIGRNRAAQSNTVDSGGLLSNCPLFIGFAAFLVLMIIELLDYVFKAGTTFKLSSAGAAI